MASPLRLEFAGALYHVTSRGDRRMFFAVAAHHDMVDTAGNVQSGFSCHGPRMGEKLELSKYQSLTMFLSRGGCGGGEVLGWL